MAKPRNTVVMTHSGNHGQAPLISYDEASDMWIINLRPKGPGSVIIRANRETMMAIVASFVAETSEEESDVGTRKSQTNG